MSTGNPVNYINSFGGYRLGDKVLLTTYQVMEIGKIWKEGNVVGFSGYQAGDLNRPFVEFVRYPSFNITIIKRKVTDEEWKSATAAVLGAQDKNHRGEMRDEYVNMADCPAKTMYITCFNEGSNEFRISY